MVPIGAPWIGVPVIGLNDSGGARLQEGVDSLGGYSVGADVSGNALISFSSGSVTLTGVDPASLQADWIV